MAAPSEGTTNADGRRRGTGWAGWAVLATGSAALVVLAVANGRRLWFYSDDWNILTGYASGGLLEPFNGHLSLLPVLAFRTLADVAGLSSYVPFRVLGLASYLLLGLAVFVYSRRRVGGVGGALVALLVLLSPAATTSVAFPFLINFSVPLAAMVAMWWFLDRDRARDEVAASAALGVGLASSGIGILAMAAAGTELLWNRAPWRRWLGMAPPVLLYVAWYAVFHAPVARGEGGPGAVAAYAGRMVLAGCASLVGGWAPAGPVVAVGFVVLVVLGVVRWRTFDGRAAGGLAAAAAFVLLTAWTRIGIVPRIPPDEPRYAWTVGVVLLLTAVHLLRRATLPRPGALAAATVAAGLLVLDAAVLGGRLAAWERQVGDAVAGVRTNLWTVELVGGSVDRDEVLPLSFIAVTAGDYLGAVERYGSPVAGFDPRRPTGTRELRDRADELVLRTGSVRLADLGPAAESCPPGAAEGAAGGTAVGPIEGPVEVASGGRVVVCASSSAAVVRAARFGDGTEVGTVAPGRAAALELPADGVPRPWAVTADGGARTVASP